MADTEIVEARRAQLDAISAFSATDLRVSIERAKSIAKELRSIVDDRGLAVQIGTSEHLVIEAWTALGAICGVAPQTEWTRIERDQNGRFDGCTARVQVIRIATGETISAAENACFVEETTKKRNGDYYHRWVENCPTHKSPTMEPCGVPSRHAILSMAQTRAASKALAQVLRWIVELAGYAGTPAEEATPNMENGNGQRRSNSRGKKDRPKLTPGQVKMLRERAEERAREFEESVSAGDLLREVLGERTIDDLFQDELPQTVKAIAFWEPPANGA